MKLKNLRLKKIQLFKAVFLYEIFKSNTAKYTYIGLLILFVVLLLISNKARPHIALIGVAIFSIQFLGQISTVNYFFKNIKKINRLTYNAEIIDNFYILYFLNEKNLKENGLIYYFKYPILDIVEVKNSFIFLLSNVGGDAIPRANSLSNVVCVTKENLDENIIKDIRSIKYSPEFLKSYYDLNDSISPEDYDKFIKENMILEQKRFENQEKA